MAANSNGFAEPKWWKEAVVYQVYPASFKATGPGRKPGWGDIPGYVQSIDTDYETHADIHRLLQHHL